MNGLFMEIIMANVSENNVNNTSEIFKQRLKEKEEKLRKEADSHEPLRVKYKGKVVTKTIDKFKNEQSVSIMQKIFKNPGKDKCDLIFLHSIIDKKKGLRMFNKRTYKDVVRARIYRFQYSMMLHKINTVLGLRCLNRLQIMKFLLKKIDITQKVFTMQIEGGQEEFIPELLS